MNTARAIRQNGLAVKLLRHHACQRTIVQRSTPTASVNCCVRHSVAPYRMIEISTTIASTYTLPPRNLNDGGVSRLRLPPAAAHKPKRWPYSGPDRQARPHDI